MADIDKPAGPPPRGAPPPLIVRPSPDAPAIITAGPSGTPEVVENLATFLQEVNGQDAYDAQTQSLGQLPEAQYLRLPVSLRSIVFDPTIVGSAVAKKRMTNDQLLTIAALNYNVLPDEDEETKIKFCLMRATAFHAGWVTTTGEVRFVEEPPSPDLVKKLIAWILANRETFKAASLMAYLTPYALRHIFHTTGHHYLSSNAAEYQKKYDSLYNSMMMLAHVNILKRELLHHTVLHWVTPGMVQQVLDAATLGSDLRTRIPHPILIRMNAPPAGTALVTTAAAVLENMKAPGFHGMIAGKYAAEIELIESTTAEIKKSPADYHLVARAYGRGEMDVAKIKRLESAKAAAAVIAPICQGYIDAYVERSSLSQARALAKSADDNPYLRKVSAIWFRTYAKKQRVVVSLIDLVSGALPPEVAEA